VVISTRQPLLSLAHSTTASAVIFMILAKFRIEIDEEDVATAPGDDERDDGDGERDGDGE